MVPANWMVTVNSRSQIAGVSFVKGLFSEYEGAARTVTRTAFSSDLTTGLKPFVERILPESLR
jgi:hypothetical protein